MSETTARVCVALGAILAGALFVGVMSFLLAPEVEPVRREVSTGIGIVAYGDALYDQVTHPHPIVQTSAMGSLRRFVNSLEPGIGQDSKQD